MYLHEKEAIDFNHGLFVILSWMVAISCPVRANTVFVMPFVMSFSNH